MARPLTQVAAALLGLGLVAGAGGAALGAPIVNEHVELAFGETELRGGLATLEAPIHLPPLARVIGARVVIGYANALAVEPEGSSLRVAINGDELVELPLVAAQGILAAEIDIPPAALRPGANRLTLTGQHRHRLECTRGAFEELWTRIEPDGTYLELSYARPAGPPRLRDLDALLAASFFDGESLGVLLGRPLDDPLALQWGGLVAEAIALRRGTRPLAVEPITRPGRGVGRGWPKRVGRHHVAVGTLDELQALLPDPLPEGAAHGLIAIRRLPSDPDHLAIVVAGATEAAVTRAAEHLRRRDVAWPARAALVLGPGRPGGELPARASGALDAGSITLAALGYHTTDLPAGYTGAIELPLHLPDDYYAGDGQRIELALDFAYGAGLEPNSALIVEVNGAPWNMLRLDRTGGDLVEGATVELPMGLFRPGPNVIGFEPVLHLAATDDCATHDDRPMFSLFDDSRVVIPPFARLARQPDLGLFAATAFPYGGHMDQVQLLVGGSDPATVASAWTLRAKLAQRHLGPLHGLTSSFDAGPSDRHLLVVAPSPALPSTLAEAVPLRLDATPPPRGKAVVATAGEATATTSPPATPGAVEATGATSRQREHWARRLTLGDGEDDLLSTMTGWIVRMARAVPVEAPTAAPTFEDLQAFDQNASTGAVVAFRSPFAADRTVTVVTAADPSRLRVATDAMVTPAIWDRLAGDVALFDPGSGAMLSHRVASPYLIAAVDTSPGHLLLLWQSFMAKHQGHWLILVLVAIGALSLVTGMTLRRMAR